MADSPTITAARLALRAAEEEQARALAAATAKSKNKTPSTPPEASPTPASPQADPTTPAPAPAPLGVQPGVTIVQDPVTKTNVVEAPETSPTPASSQADPTTPAPSQASSAPTTTSGAEQTATDFSLAFGQAKVHVNALFTFLHNTGNAADLDLQGLETHLRALLAPMRTLLSKT